MSLVSTSQTVALSALWWTMLRCRKGWTAVMDRSDIVDLAGSPRMA